MSAVTFSFIFWVWRIVNGWVPRYTTKQTPLPSFRRDWIQWNLSLLKFGPTTVNNIFLKILLRNPFFMSNKRRENIISTHFLTFVCWDYLFHTFWIIRLRAICGGLFSNLNFYRYFSKFFYMFPSQWRSLIESPQWLIDIQYAHHLQGSVPYCEII